MSRRKLSGVERLRVQLELEGFDPETQEFKTNLRVRRIQICQEQKGASSCRDCHYFFWCELAKEQLLAMHHPPNPPTKVGSE